VCVCERERERGEEEKEVREQLVEVARTRVVLVMLSNVVDVCVRG